MESIGSESMQGDHPSTICSTRPQSEMAATNRFAQPPFRHRPLPLTRPDHAVPAPRLHVRVHR